MELKVNIYVLIDPITCKIRYIGRTKNRLEIRLRGHMSKCLHKKNSQRLLVIWVKTSWT